MPVFSKELPALDKHMGFDLKRCPESKPLDAIVTCEEFLVTQTHFWGGRTVPHELENCQACLKMQPYRTHVYVSAVIPATREHFIFECSANAAKAFDEYHKSYGTLRGCLFRASRPKATRNGKVVILTRQADLQKCPLPTAPDLEIALCVIWQIPYSKQGKTPTSLKKSGLNIDKKLKKAHLEPEDNAPEPSTIGEIINGSNENF
jgi:hypothetical protein